MTTEYDSTGDSATFSGTYTVTSDGGFSIADTDLEGQTSADGNLFAVTDTNPDDDDGDIILGVGLKYGSGMDVSVLNGSYTVCQIRNDGETKASRMSFTFDGSGTLRGQLSSDGEVFILVDSDISSDGEVMLAIGIKES